MMLQSLSPARRAALTVQVFKGVEQPTQFALSIVAARALPANEFGTAAILISVQALYLAVCSFGFDETVQRLIAARDRRSESELMAIAIRARAVAMGIGVGLGVGAAAFLHGDADVALALVWLGFYAAATIGANLVQQVALAKYDVGFTSAASVLSWLVPTALLATGSFSTVAGYMGALAVGAVSRLLISLIWYMRSEHATVRIGALLQRQSTRLLEPRRSHVSLVLYDVTDQVLARHGDVFVAGVVGLAAATIGAYALAFQITAACNQFLLLGLGAVGLSRLSQSRADAGTMREHWRRLTTASATLTVGPLAAIVLVAPEVVRFGLGGKYPGMVGILRALAATQWVARLSGGGTNTTALIALGHMDYVGRSAVLGAVLNLVLDAVLAPLLGSYGLALGSAVAIMVVGFANVSRLGREFRVLPRSTVASVSWIRGLELARSILPSGYLMALSVLFGAAESIGLATSSVVVRSVALGVIGILWLGLGAREVRR